MADIHPGSWIGDSVEEFKKMPTWGKIVAAGVLLVVIVLAIRSRQKGASAPAASPTTDSAAAGPQSAFPMVGNTPVLPSNVNPIYDPSGGLVGYQQNPPAAPVATGQPIIAGPPMQQGTTFRGPTGVNHFISTGGMTLDQIAKAQGLSGWNSLYAIPENQRIFGKMNAATAKNYKPPVGSYVVLPGTPAKGGGPDSMTTLALMKDPGTYLNSAAPH